MLFDLLYRWLEDTYIELVAPSDDFPTPGTVPGPIIAMIRVPVFCPSSLYIQWGVVRFNNPWFWLLRPYHLDNRLFCKFFC